MDQLLSMALLVFVFVPNSFICFYLSLLSFLYFRQSKDPSCYNLWSKFVCIFLESFGAKIDKNLLDLLSNVAANVKLNITPLAHEIKCYSLNLREGKGKVTEYPEACHRIFNTTGSFQITVFKTSPDLLPMPHLLLWMSPLKIASLYRQYVYQNLIQLHKVTVLLYFKISDRKALMSHSYCFSVDMWRRCNICTCVGEVLQRNTTQVWTSLQVFKPNSMNC